MKTIKNKMRLILKFRTQSLILFMLCLSGYLSAQIKMGDNPTSKDVSTVLEIERANKGLLMPRIGLTGSTDNVTIPSPANTLLIYNTANAGTYLDTVVPGYYYWDGLKWVKLGTDIKKGWDINGNSATDPSTNFLGTTDNVDLVFKRDGIHSGWVNNSNENTSFGINSLPQSNVSSTRLTAFGHNSMVSSPYGWLSTAVGANTLMSNTSSENSAIGYNSMRAGGNVPNNTIHGANSLMGANTGVSNSTTGANSLIKNTEGQQNATNGYLSLSENIGGNYNTTAGAFTLYNNTWGGDHVAIGYEALYSFANANYDNTAIGTGSMRSLLNNAANTAIGYRSFSNHSFGGLNIIIGANQTVLSAWNQLNIGGALFGSVNGGNRIGILTSNYTSVLNVNGSFSSAIRKSTVSTTLTESDYTVIFNGPDNILSNPFITTLPDPTTCQGRVYRIVWGASTNSDRFMSFNYPILFDNGLQLSPSTAINSNSIQNESNGIMVLISDGSDWWSIGE